MTFENNFVWPGTTAIVYNVELDHNFLGFTVWFNINLSSSNKTMIILPEDSLIEGIGIQYKKESDNEWNDLLILNNTDLEPVKNHTLSAQNATNLAKLNIDKTKYAISSPVPNLEFEFISPLRVVILNLEQSTTYNVRSYYIENGNKNYYNECSTTTFERQDIYYECIEVTGGNETQNNTLKNRINEGCAIYNAMTNFKKSTAPSDNLGSKNGGQFKGTYDPTLYQQGAAAHSGMYFASYTPNVSTVVHEIAHNVMKNQIDERENEYAYNKIIKFMEFATHSNKATWRWQSGHNYPVISSATYSDAYLYIVAAATQVCRDASNLI